MPLYTYKYQKNGAQKEETKEYSDKKALYSAVRTGGGTIVSVEEVRMRKSPLKFFSFGKGVGIQDQITFAKNLAVMIDAGLSISRALSVLQKQSRNKKLVAILDGISVSVNGGETLSKSLEAYPEVFSGLFVSMVKAGEESGKLAYCLRVVAEQLEKSYTLAKKIKGAMMYPSVIVCVMVILGVVMMIYMVPTLTETFIGLNIALPLPTRIIIAISDFLRDLIILVLGFGGASVLGFIYSLKTERGKNAMDTITLHLPMINTMSREINAARTARTLSSLVSSGVDIVSALGITSSVLQNHYFRDLLTEAGKQVQVGELLSVSLANSNGNLYPVFVGEMLAVGEETGKMTDMLDNIATYYEAEVDQKTKNLGTIIEPLLMVLIGVAVGIFAVAMMLPTYSLVDSIQ